MLQAPAVAGDRRDRLRSAYAAVERHDSTGGVGAGDGLRPGGGAELAETDGDNARLATAGPVGTVKELRQQDGGDIVVLASTSVIRQLLDAGEPDRLSITLCRGRLQRPEAVAYGADHPGAGAQPGALKPRP